MIRKSEDLPGKYETVGVDYSVEEMFKQLNMPGYFSRVTEGGSAWESNPLRHP
jgi:hypothetical protein